MSLLDDLNDLVKEHAEKYDKAVLMSEGATKSDLVTGPLTAPSAKPLYLAHLEERAAGLGISVADAYAHDQQLLGKDDFPTPQCLKPGEVRTAVASVEKLEPARKAHYEGCSYCRTTVFLAKPSPAAASAFARSAAAMKTKETTRSVQAAGSEVRPATPVPARSGPRKAAEYAEHVLAALAAVIFAAVVIPLCIPSSRPLVTSTLKQCGISLNYNWADPGTERTNPSYLSMYYSVEPTSLKRHEETAGEATKLITSEPRNTAAYRIRANAWTDLREYEKAAADWNQVLALDPKDETAADRLKAVREALERKNESKAETIPPPPAETKK